MQKNQNSAVGNIKPWRKVMHRTDLKMIVLCGTVIASIVNFLFR
jgi:hypothetical protein